jgi:cation:H+ antiporter
MGRDEGVHPWFRLGPVLFNAVVFLVSLGVLLAAARAFTTSAERIGLYLGMSPFAVGVLIVSIGTSLPEMISSVIAVTRGTSEIVVGNVLGANLSNLLLVMGVVAVSAPRQVRLGEQYILIDLHYLLGAVCLLALALKDGLVGRLEGGVLLVAYVAYVVYLLREGRTEKDVLVGVKDGHLARRQLPIRHLAIVAGSAALIYLGARHTIASLESIAAALGVPPAIIAVTVLSLGTTLPELVVSATAARAGKADVAVGNILGSCVFNSLGVAGVAALVGPVHATPDLLGLPLPVFAASALLFYLLTLDKRVSRWEGLIFVLLYTLFVLEISRLV